MEKAFVFLATGFEEMEALGTVDVLRRAGIQAITVSVSNEKTVVGAHGIPVTADALLTDTSLGDAVALVLPGGMPGATNLNASSPLKEALLKQNEKGGIVAAICGLGLLNGRRATCYPGFESYLTGATATGEPAVVDGNVITGKGPGLVYQFALALVTAIKSKAIADEVAAGLLL